MTRIAVYPGTFDPVTNGHLDLVDRGRRHFDRLVVGVSRNDEKGPLFPIDQRVELFRTAVQDWPNVDIESFDGLLVEFAERIGATMILRGIRAVTDLEYEMQMAMMNRRMNDGLETVFLVPSETYSYLSSRLVREVAGLGGRLDGLVPDGVARALERHFAFRGGAR